MAGMRQVAAILAISTVVFSFLAFTAAKDSEYEGGLTWQQVAMLVSLVATVVTTVIATG